METGNDTKTENLPNSVSNLLGFESFPPQGGEDAVRPVVGGDVQRAEHLRGRDGFGVHPHLPVGGTTFRHGLHQRVDAGCLPGAAGTQRHHTCTIQQCSMPN